MKYNGIKNGFNNYIVPGYVIEFDTTTLNPNESITDLNGNGITFYVHQCPICNRKFYHMNISLVPLACSGECYEQLREIL